MANKYSAMGIEKGQEDNEIPLSLNGTFIDYSTITSLKGAFSGGGIDLAFAPTGSIQVSASKRIPVEISILTDKTMPSGEAVQGEIGKVFQSLSKRLILAPGEHEIGFESKIGQPEGVIKIEGGYYYNGAPGVLKAACSLEKGCEAQAPVLRLTEEAKKEMALVPSLEVPKEMVGKAGSAYCLIYWREQNKFYMLTEHGIIPFEGNLEPYASNIQFGRAMTFNVITNALDLTGFNGTLDLFLAVSTRDDLGDLMYNWYELRF